MRLPLLLLLALALGGCATSRTRLETSWRSPEATTLSFERVLVLASMPDAATTRRIEEGLAARLPGGVAAHRVLADEVRGDEARLKQAVRASGVDGLIVVRLVGREERQRWVPGDFPAYYYTPYGYHRYRGPYTYDPGYMRVEEVFQLETNVYDVADEALLWSGLASTVSPRSMEQLVEEQLEVVGAELRRQGLVAAPPAGG
jgi:hypothetical protein